LGSKNKLKRFNENETFSNVIQPTREEILGGFSWKGKWNRFFQQRESYCIGTWLR
jgi:tRNA (guanine-N7-)-methyltransferase